MKSICLYFQCHQPERIKTDYKFFDIGRKFDYFDNDLNQTIINKVSDYSYLPSNDILYNLIKKHQGRFKVAFSLTGVLIDQLERWRPDVIDSFKRLAQTGCVEFLTETYYHSIACFFSETEFKKQIKMHTAKMKELFGQKPVTFRNTELIYDNKIAQIIESEKFKVILSEGANQILGWRSPNVVYVPKPCKKIKLLLKNYRLSDDLAFRFSDYNWKDYPLTAEKFASWIKQIPRDHEIINLFMDYETFGEHHKKKSGILDFLKEMPNRILATSNVDFVTPAEAAASHSPVAKIDAPHPVSWADLERDVTAWIGNPLQDASLESLYNIEKKVMKTKDPDIISIWRKLQSSDHFYYMCTKWASDGAVHSYFSPFAGAEDAYVTYTNVLNDFKLQIASRSF